MRRTDLRIKRGKVTVHPKKFEAMKKNALTRIGSDGRAILRDVIVDQELEMYVEQIVVAEIESELRAEIRSMLAEGVQ